MFRKLLDQVRIEGNIDIGSELFLKDTLPVIYERETDEKSVEAVKYINSGGRSIMFEKGGEVYRIKGVDPYGKLTHRVASSKENRMHNVKEAGIVSQFQPLRKGEALLFGPKKPFGPFLIEQAECEANAFETLAKVYQTFGFENPCKFLFHKDSEIKYQTAFSLPSTESDFRIHEWNSLLTERLDKCTPDEIEVKSKNIGILYGRFIFWAGVNTALLAVAGLLPIADSFVPQNWVISKYKNGYGIFRVDHTSTKTINPKEALHSLMQEKYGAPKIVNEFSVYPGRVQMAARPKAFLNGTHYKFSEVLLTRGEILKQGVSLDETGVLDAHNISFSGGLMAVLGGLPFDPIPEEMFRDALN